ncbi:hypothetical protein CVT26_001585 [Gymnopilus dilepis]|uniref:Phosphatidate phosphatase APP1 catalytic domain-containing protein n=1 Tax=Gymnopilus dilepis TaxID=231916 RepID=A0A409VTL9_9AGAR|nr:hypothetical protein CVT26_001585 [Gymnopilus dilepis]
MAEDMPLSSSSSSWKYLSSASSRITSLKGYIANHHHQHYSYRESVTSSGASSTSYMSYSSTSSSAMGAGAGSGSRFSAGGQYSPNDVPQYGSTSTQGGSSSDYPQQTHQHQPQHHQPPPQLQQQHQPPPYQHQSAPRQSWRAWAGQKIRAHAAKRGYGVGGSGNKNGGAGPASSNTEVVNVFPGWAVRRYRPLEADGERNEQGPRPFDLEVFISGYAITHRAPENMSRAQRGFLRLAKGFASLPKIIDTPQPSSSSPTPLSQVKLTPSTEALLASITLPPRPTEITDDFDVDALDRQLRKAKEGVGRDWRKEQEEDEEGSSSSSSSARGSTVDLRAQSQRTQGSAPAPGFPPGEPPANPSPHNPAEATQEMIRRLHANLEKRLQPFWASVLAGRGVRVMVFPLPHSSASSQPSSSSSSSQSPSTSRGQDINFHELLSEEAGPLASAELQTAADGSFQVRLRVTWEELCLHPRALHIAFREPTTTTTGQGQGLGEEDEVVVLVELLGPKEGSAFSSPSSSRVSLAPEPSPQPTPLPSIPSPRSLTTTRIPLTHTPTVRVISDIDDTIKLSGILSGARAVFHNVFVKDLKESVIPGMGEWYVDQANALPFQNTGSIKLRSYAGRSLFNGLLSAPAARKRAGVTDILDAFPESKFFLIGDSGEQDMELYADIARERPHQILAIYIRDADAFTYNGPEPLEDPTGWKAIASGDAGTRPSGKPLVQHAPQATRSDSMMTTSSSASGSTTSSNLDRYDYGAVGETPSRESWRNSLVGVSRQNSDFETPLEPPRPQFWSESPGNGNGRQSYGMGGRGAMSAEPEPLIDLSDSPGSEEAANATPRTSSSARMDSPHVNAERQETATPTQRHRARLQSPPSQTQAQAQGQSQRQYVTEPPPPTPPPSSNTTFPYSHPHSNSQTHPYRTHHPSSSASSLSSSASTSTTNLSKHQYGYFSGNSQAAATSATTNSNPNPSPSPTKKGSTSSGSTSGMTENEKKRHELQLRVWRARTQIPPEVMLRVFRDPIGECVGEAAEVLDREGM